MTSTKNEIYDLFEPQLRNINLVVSLSGFLIGASFCDGGVSRVLGAFLFFHFFLINALLGVCRKGMICQTILLASSMLFICGTAYDFHNAFFVNPDAQSGLVLLLGPAYTIIMIPFWIIAYLASSKYEWPSKV